VSRRNRGNNRGANRASVPAAVKHVEGEVYAGPYLMSDGWLPVGTSLNFWQLGQNVRPYGNQSAMVRACVSAYSETVAMCPGDHWRRLDNGGRERQPTATSALARVIAKPNDYQSSSDFLTNLTRALYSDGNAYAIALRNARFEIAELHLMRYGEPIITQTGEIAYDLDGNEILEARIDGRLLVPARNVLHVRLETPNHPLKGVPPIFAAALDLAARDAMMRQQLQYYMNQGRPSTVLVTDLRFTQEQTAEARMLWDAQTKGLNQGGTPILSGGLKPFPLARTSEESQLAEIMKMTDQNISLAYRVPLAILGMGEHTFASTELLMQSWIASGLGYALNHIEVAFDRLFGLKGYPEEYLELNTKSLLRSAFKDRIEAFGRAVQTGLYTHDEARNEEDLPTVPFGDQPLVQEQMVSLEFAANRKEPAPAPLALPAPDEPEAEPDEEEADAAEDKRFTADAIAARIFDRARSLH